MPKIESPLGSRSFNNQGMREINVPDESGYHQNYNFDNDSMMNFQKRVDEAEDVNQIEEQLQKARLSQKGKERISDPAKKRIEMLMGMTSLTKEVNIEGNLYGLKSLKSKDMREALSEVAKVDGTLEAPYEIRKQLLARSLTHIAGIELDQFIGDSSLNSKLLFVDNLDDALVARLYNEYVLLANEIKQKYSIQNENDLKEVIEDSKK